MKWSYKHLTIVLVATLTRPVGVHAQDDNFSLDGGNIPNGVNTDSKSIDDFGQNSNLFGDGPVEEPLEDSKSTLVKPAAPETGLTSPSLAPSPALVAPASAAPSTGLSQPSAPAALLAPSPAPATLPAGGSINTGLNSSTPDGVEAGGDVPVAPLVGDGSMAPVKSGPTRAVNEFGGVPPLPGTRRAMAAGEAPEFYDVEEGDTMFDVCSQLIDDGNYWPKLWSLNPDVKNPHFIYPGMKLAFYSGDKETPPFLEVVTEDEMVPVEKETMVEAELVAEPQTVATSMGSEGGSVKVVNGIEEEVPVMVVGPSDIGADGDGLDGFIFAGKINSTDDVGITVPAFYYANELEPLAEVVEGRSGELMAGDEAKILVSPANSLGVGTYTVLRKVGSVSSARSGDDIGYRYEFEGNIRITRQTKSGLMEGVVFEAHNGVKSGDILVNFISTRRTISGASAVGSIMTANSSVIGFQEAGKYSGGKGDLIFLEKQGLSVGGYYSIFSTGSNRDIRHTRESDIGIDGGAVAVARVIEIAGEAALGYIVDGRTEVRVGDSLSLQ